MECCDLGAVEMRRLIGAKRLKIAVGAGGQENHPHGYRKYFAAG